MKKIRDIFKFEYRITLAYVLFGILWILFSDEILNGIVPDTELRASIQLFKGWFYVILTAIFFFCFIKKHLKRWRRSEDNLSKTNEELRQIRSILEIQNKELNNAKLKAEESSRLKTAFLNNISHEFRTPMNSILGFTGMLTRYDISNEQRSVYASYINHSTHQLLDMVTDVVEISQVQLGKITLEEKTCDINEILNKVVDKATKKATEKNIEVLFKNELNDDKIRLDCYKLFRILGHLMDNAVKFTTSGSVTLKIGQSSGKLKITVTDTGSGIPNDIKEKIFEAFRQAEYELHSNYGGSGIGLSLVKAYAEAMKGTLNIESTGKKGTRVLLSIPYRPAKETSSDNKAQVKESLSTKTILIADDEIVNYYYLKELLDKMNIKTLHAPNGQVALDICKDRDDIDMVMMDIKMPVMDGYKATKAIRTFNKDIPVIAQSAYVLEKDEQTSQFNDILPKPIAPERLEGLLKKYL